MMMMVIIIIIIIIIICRTKVCSAAFRNIEGWFLTYMQNNSCELFLTSVSVCDIIRVMKSSKMRYVGHVMCVGEGRNSGRVVVPVLDGKQSA